MPNGLPPRFVGESADQRECQRPVAIAPIKTLRAFSLAIRPNAQQILQIFSVNSYVCLIDEKNVYRRFHVVQLEGNYFCFFFVHFRKFHSFWYFLSSIRFKNYNIFIIFYGFSMLNEIDQCFHENIKFFFLVLFVLNSTTFLSSKYIQLATIF